MAFATRRPVLVRRDNNFAIDLLERRFRFPSRRIISWGFDLLLMRVRRVARAAFPERGARDALLRELMGLTGLRNPLRGRLVDWCVSAAMGGGGLVTERRRS